MPRFRFRRAFGASLTIVLATPAGATPIFGRWLTDDGAAIVRIEPCGQKLCGRIERVLDPRAPANDVNSPDPAHRAKPLVGTPVLSDFAGSGGSWNAGLAYDPRAGRSYRSQLQLLGEGRLKVTGCILLLCRSRYWTRIR